MAGLLENPTKSVETANWSWVLPVEAQVIEQAGRIG